MRHILLFAVGALAWGQANTGTYTYSSGHTTPPQFPAHKGLRWIYSPVIPSPVSKNAATGTPGTCAGIIAGMSHSFFTTDNISFNGFSPYPVSDIYRDISGVAAHPDSDTWTATITGGFTKRLFGGASRDWRARTTLGGVWDGLPFHVVTKDQPRVEVRFDLPTGTYAWASDPGPYPIPYEPAVEGTFGVTKTLVFSNYNLPGDKHLFIIDRDDCVGYELWSAFWDEGKLRARTGGVYDLLAGDHQRPYFTGTADVAGTFLMGMMADTKAWVDGTLNHAIASSLYGSSGRAAATGMAQAHQYGPLGTNNNYPPFGARWRLKASFDIDAWVADMQTSAGNPNFKLTAAEAVRVKNIMLSAKKYGFVYTDGQNDPPPPWSPQAWTTPSIYGMSANEFNTIWQMGPTFNSDFEWVASSDPLFGDVSKGLTGPGALFACTATPNAAWCNTQAPPSITQFSADKCTTPATACPAGTAVTFTWSVDNVPTRLRWLIDGKGGGLGVVHMNPDGSAPTSATMKFQQTTTMYLMVQNGTEFKGTDGKGAGSGRKYSAGVVIYIL